MKLSDPNRRRRPRDCARGLALALGGLGALLALGLLTDCPGAAEDPLAAGLTPEIEAEIIDRSIREIESAENYGPDDFEAQQRAHIEGMSAELREPALDSLSRRVEKIAILGMSQTVELDREDVTIESRVAAPGEVVAQVTVTGSRSYRTNNASKTTRTRYTLAWTVGSKRGELVFHHRGLRRTDLRD